MSTINYTPSGPVSAAFHDSPAFVRGIKGPIGSGKSVSCCMEILKNALMQELDDTGKAKIRAVIVRNSYPELKSTTIKTWLTWFPEETFGKIKWDAPITHRVKLSKNREIEAVFLAMDRPDDTKKLLSLESTVIWLNEARELPKAVLDAATGRVGRYPAAATRKAVIMDTNSMDDDHWWYKLAEEERPSNYAFFNQPSGLDPDAENLNFLNQTPRTIKLPIDHPDRIAQGRAYYLDLVPGKAPEWIKVYIDNQYASVSDGKPVFPEFSDTIHVAKFDMDPHKGLPLYLGFDFGLTPACTIGQLTQRGQLRILDEVVGFDMGLKQFLATKLMPVLASDYANMRYISYIDPAGNQRAQGDSEVMCRRILEEAGLNPEPAQTNDFLPRREAAVYFMNRLTDGEPGVIIAPKCKSLRKALNGDYKYKRVQVPGEERYKDVPDKNKSSHIAESFSYLCIGLHKPGIKTKGRKIDHLIRHQKEYKPAQAAGY